MPVLISRRPTNCTHAAHFAAGWPRWGEFAKWKHAPVEQRWHGRPRSYRSAIPYTKWEHLYSILLFWLLLPSESGKFYFRPCFPCFSLSVSSLMGNLKDLLNTSERISSFRSTYNIPSGVQVHAPRADDSLDSGSRDGMPFPTVAIVEGVSNFLSILSWFFSFL